MKTIDLTNKGPVVKTGEIVLEEDASILVPITITGFEKEAIVGNGENIKVSIDYEGTTEDWKRVYRGTEETWMETSDWSPSYGGATLPQRYSRYYSWFKNVDKPVIIHCSNGDVEEDGKEVYPHYNVWR